MTCERCGKASGLVEVYREEYPCGCCDAVNVIVYEICISCGFLVKTYNGEPMVDGSLQGSFILSEEDMPEIGLDDFFEEMTKHVRDKVSKNPSSMTDMIHKCLRCHKFAYECSEGKYKCSDPDCGFSWEVIECG